MQALFDLTSEIWKPLSVDHLCCVFHFCILPTGTKASSALVNTSIGGGFISTYFLKQAWCTGRLLGLSLRSLRKLSKYLWLLWTGIFFLLFLKQQKILWSKLIAAVKNEKIFLTKQESLTRRRVIKAFLKAFPTKMKPTKCPATEKNDTRKPKKRGEACSCPNFSSQDILYLDQKASKCTTSKWLYGKFLLFKARQWLENRSTSFKSVSRQHFRGANGLITSN